MIKIGTSYERVNASTIRIENCTFCSQGTDFFDNSNSFSDFSYDGKANKYLFSNIGVGGLFLINNKINFTNDTNEDTFCFYVFSSHDVQISGNEIYVAGNSYENDKRIFKLNNTNSGDIPINGTIIFSNNSMKIIGTTNKNIPSLLQIRRGTTLRMENNVIEDISGMAEPETSEIFNKELIQIGEGESGNIKYCVSEIYIDNLNINLYRSSKIDWPLVAIKKHVNSYADNSNHSDTGNLVIKNLNINLLDNYKNSMNSDSERVTTELYPSYSEYYYKNCALFILNSQNGLNSKEHSKVDLVKDIKINALGARALILYNCYVYNANIRGSVALYCSQFYKGRVYGYNNNKTISLFENSCLNIDSLGAKTVSLDNDFVYTDGSAINCFVKECSAILKTGNFTYDSEKDNIMLYCPNTRGIGGLFFKTRLRQCCKISSSKARKSTTSKTSMCASRGIP